MQLIFHFDRLNVSLKFLENTVEEEVTPASNSPANDTPFVQRHGMKCAISYTNVLSAII